MHQPEDNGASPAIFETFGFGRLFAAISAATFAFAQILHEAGHAVYFMLQGRSPTWGVSSIVQISDRAPMRPEEWSSFVDPDGNSVWLYVDSLPSATTDWVLFLLAGPIAQFLAIAVGLLVYSWSASLVSRRMGLLVALVNSFAMTLSYTVGFLRGASGDEYLVGRMLDIRPALIVGVFLLVSAIALVAAFKFVGPGRERLRAGILLLLANAVLGPAIFKANGMIREGVDAGHPLLDPILGFSAPVALATCLALGVVYRVLSVSERPAAQS